MFSLEECGCDRAGSKGSTHLKAMPHHTRTVKGVDLSGRETEHGLPFQAGLVGSSGLDDGLEYID